MIQQGATQYGSPRHRCTYCHKPLPGPRTVTNPCCGDVMCLQRAELAAFDAMWKRRQDVGDRP